MKGTAKKNLEEFAAVAAGGAVLRRYLEGERQAYRAIETVEQLLAGFEGFVCPRDREVLREENLEFQLASCRLISRDGIWGWYDDDLAMWNPWGFDPSQIAVPLSIWYGKDDQIIPVGEGEFLAKLIPAAQLHLLDGQGHFSLYPDYLSSILDDLIARGA